LRTIAFVIFILVSVAGAAPFAYVSNEESKTISVINTASNNVITTIPLAVSPWGIVATTDEIKSICGRFR
jgi:YVTN family beta-propeller protein